MKGTDRGPWKSTVEKVLADELTPICTLSKSVREQMQKLPCLPMQCSRVPRGTANSEQGLLSGFLEPAVKAGTNIYSETPRIVSREGQVFS